MYLILMVFVKKALGLSFLIAEQLIFTYVCEHPLVICVACQWSEVAMLLFCWVGWPFGFTWIRYCGLPADIQSYWLVGNGQCEPN